MKDSIQPSSPTTGQAKPKGADSLWAKGAAIVGVIVGLAFGRYCGSMLLVPGIAGGLAAFGLAKTMPADRKPIIAAVSLQFGQAVWILVGLLMASGFGTATSDAGPFLAGMELVVYVAGLAYFAASPTWISAGLLIGYQTLGIIYNAIGLNSYAPGSLEHKAIVTHLGLRLFSIVCLVVAVRTLNKTRRAAAGADVA